MIPDAKILRRDPYRSFLSDSHYSPFFLISSNAHRLHPIEPTDFVGSIEFNLTHVHEHTHWFQQIGTTFGAFMDALRSSQRHTLLRFIRDQPRAKRAELVRARLDRGRPFIELNPENQYLNFKNDKCNARVSVLKQIWFDHQWLHALLDDSRSTKNLGHPPPDACGQVIADVILNCCDTLNFVSDDYRVAGHQNARQWYFADDTILSKVLVDLGDGLHHHLTSTGLIECAASLNELQQNYGDVFRIVSGKHNLGTAHADAFLNSSYALPFRMFIGSAPEHFKDPRIGLAALNLVIYFSLNPPLPPRVLSVPRRSHRWVEIYPPHRFITAIRALRNISPLVDPYSIDAMQEFLKALGDESSLPYAADSPMPLRSSVGPDWDDYSEVDECPFLIDEELIIQAQLHINKIPTRLPLLANYSSCIQGPLSRQFARLLLNHEERFDFMRPPLEFLEDGKIGFAGSKAFGNNLVRSVAASHALFEFACGAGPMKLDQLPAEVRDDLHMIDFMHRTVHHMIVETDNQ